MKLPNMGHIKQHVTKSIALETTKAIMRQAMTDMRMPRVHTLARFLVKDLAPTNKHPIVGRLSEMAAIDQFIRRTVRYTRDPYQTELVHSPSVMLKRIEEFGKWAEDCESMAGLTLALLLALGHRCRLTIVGFRQPDVFTHIFCEALVPRVGWLVVDPSVADLVQSKEMLSRIRHTKHIYPEHI